MQLRLFFVVAELSAIMLIAWPSFALWHPPPHESMKALLILLLVIALINFLSIALLQFLFSRRSGGSE